jgi:hypothetical protein
MLDWNEFKFEPEDITDVLLFRSVQDCRENFIGQVLKARQELKRINNPAGVISSMFSTAYNSMNNSQLIIAFLAAIEEIGQLREQIRTDVEG